MSNFKYKKYILETLEKYKKYFKNEEKRFELLEKQLQGNENLWTRKNFNWHLTASAYIFDKSMQNFVVIHNINLDKWLVPGWHWERQHFHHDFRYIFIYDWDFSEINIEAQEIKWFQILNINDDLTKLAWNDVILKIKNISKK